MIALLLRQESGCYLDYCSPTSFEMICDDGRNLNEFKIIVFPKEDLKNLETEELTKFLGLEVDGKGEEQKDIDLVLEDLDRLNIESEEIEELLRQREPCQRFTSKERLFLKDLNNQDGMTISKICDKYFLNYSGVHKIIKSPQEADESLEILRKEEEALKIKKTCIRKEISLFANSETAPFTVKDVCDHIKKQFGEDVSSSCVRKLKKRV